MKWSCVDSGSCEFSWLSGAVLAELMSRSWNRIDTQQPMTEFFFTPFFENGGVMNS